jgi:starch phosphorylase
MILRLRPLYDKLEHVILPLYHSQPMAYAEVMRSAIALNGSFFNTQRMLSQYLLNAYYPQLGNAQDRERARPAIAKTPVANPA